jgi:hypothetical protein
LHFTIRAVITPVIGEHNGFFLELPWKIAITTYSLELRNLLIHRHGYSSEQATEKISNALVVYDRFMHDLLNILIEEASSESIEYIDIDGIKREFNINGLPIVFVRNPTLSHGSIQLFSVNKIKKDIADETISISSIVLVAPNGDHRLMSI